MCFHATHPRFYSTISTLLMWEFHLATSHSSPYQWVVTGSWSRQSLLYKLVISLSVSLGLILNAFFLNLLYSQSFIVSFVGAGSGQTLSRLSGSLNPNVCLFVHPFVTKLQLMLQCTLRELVYGTKLHVQTPRFKNQKMVKKNI